MPGRLGQFTNHPKLHPGGPSTPTAWTLTRFRPAIGSAVETSILNNAAVVMVSEDATVTLAAEGSAAVVNAQIIAPQGVEVSTVEAYLNAGIVGFLAPGIIRHCGECPGYRQL